VSVKIFHHVVDGAVQNFAVGIQTKYVFAPGDDDGLVVGFGEAGVFFVFDDDDFREFFPDSLHGTVFGIIIGDDYFKIGIFGFVIHRLNAGDREMFFAGVDDSYG